MPSGLPLNVTAAILTTRSIQVVWEPPLTDLQNGIIQYYLVMVLVQQTGLSLSINASTTTSITIPDLHPAYVYSIEVAAVTVSVGPYSAPISITTPDDSKCAHKNVVSGIEISTSDNRCPAWSMEVKGASVIAPHLP